MSEYLIREAVQMFYLTYREHHTVTPEQESAAHCIMYSMLTTYLLILLDLVVLNDSMSLKQRVFTLFFCGNEYAICTKIL